MDTDDPITTVIVSTLLGAGSQVVAHQAKQKAAGEAKSQQRQQERMVKEAETRQGEEEQLYQVTQTRAAARAEQQRRAAAAGGREGTILTGPLGAPTEGQPAGRKTLLGY